MKEAKAILREAIAPLLWNSRNLNPLRCAGLALVLLLLAIPTEAQLRVENVAPLFPKLTFQKSSRLLTWQPNYVPAPIQGSMVRPQPIPRFRHEAFFCRLEDRWLVNNHFPLRFRLGSVPYVDALEGK